MGFFVLRAKLAHYFSKRPTLQVMLRFLLSSAFWTPLFASTLLFYSVYM